MKKEASRNSSDLWRLASAPEDSDQALVVRYLGSEADFWKNVQEPSRRVKDPELLLRLARVAIATLDNRLVRASAIISIIYRSFEPAWVNILSCDDILHDADRAHKDLVPKAGFGDCRWYLSMALARAALHLSNGQSGLALNVLASVDELGEMPFVHGQLFTNVVKSTLLRLVLVSRFGLVGDAVGNVVGQAERVLAKSNIIPVNYKFTNEWAYEEVAYVYTMLREVYNWVRLGGGSGMPLSELERAGFRWRCIGAPFKGLVEV